MTIKHLILFLTLFFQDEPKIVLDDNGVTLKCTPSAEVGQTYIFNDTTYLVVDNELLKELVVKEESVQNVVTTYVTDMSYLFYENEDFNENVWLC
jgi:predicted metalloprotease